MHENIKESIEIQNRILKKVSDNNNHEIGATSSLNTIIVGLAVEETKIPKPNGLLPMIKRLREINKELHDSTEELVNKDRGNLQKATKEIQEFALNTIDLMEAYSNYVKYMTKSDKIDLKDIKDFDKDDINKWKNSKEV